MNVPAEQTVATTPPQAETLAERVGRANKVDSLPSPPRFTRFFRRTNFKKPDPSLRLPSGLSTVEAATIADAISTALRQLHLSGKTLAPDLDPAQIKLSGPTPLQIELATALPEQSQSETEQISLGRIYYYLLTGQKLPTGKLTDSQLALDYPQTVAVLERAAHNRYNSTTELTGAFGWSLYRREQLQHAPQIADPRPLELIDPANPVPARNLPTLVAFGGMALAALLLLVFVIYSALNMFSGSPNEANVVTPILTAPPLARPSPTGPLQNSRRVDGSQVTRFNPALNPAETGKYVAPEDLAPGGVASLTGPRRIAVTNVQWAVGGQNVYLGLQDGGWEVWDTVSKSRVSRRELPNSEQYLTVSWSPDGENFAALGLDGQLRLGSAGRVLRSVPVAANTNGSYGWQLTVEADLFSWSPDSNYLLVRVPDNKLQDWNFQGESGPQLITPPTSQAPLNTVGLPLIWMADSQSFGVFSNNISGLLTVYDSKTLARRYRINLYDKDVPVLGGTVPSEAQLGNGGTQMLAWSPNGRQLALLHWRYSSRDGASGPSAIGTLFIWDVLRPDATDQTDIAPLKPESVQIILLGETARIGNGYLDWSRDGRLLVIMGSRNQPIRTSAPLPNDTTQIIIYSRSRAANKWEETNNYGLPDSRYYYQAHWSPEGRRILVNNAAGLLVIYRLPPENAANQVPEEIVLSSANQPRYWMWSPSPDGKWLVTVDDPNSGLILRETKTGQTLPPLTSPVGISARPQSFLPVAQPVRWSPDSQYFAALFIEGRNDLPLEEARWLIRVWKIEGGKPVVYGDIVLPKGSSNQFDWNPQASKPELFYEYSNCEVAAFDLSQPPPSVEEQNQWQDPKATPNQYCTPNSQETTRLLPSLKLPFRIVGRLPGQAGPRANSFSSYANYNMRTWFPGWKAVVSRTSNELALGILKLRAPNVPLTAEDEILLDPNPISRTRTIWSEGMDVSPDGKLVAVGLDNGLVQIYDAGSGKLLQAISAHQGVVTSLGFSPDGKRLATTSSDRSVKVWDTTTWRSTNTLYGSSQTIISVRWLPDSRSLISYSNGDSLVWRLG